MSYLRWMQACSILILVLAISHFAQIIFLVFKLIRIFVILFPVKTICLTKIGQSVCGELISLYVNIWWPVGRVCLFADYTISLSSLCRLIWRHWTTKMLVRYMLPSVCLRFRQFSQLSFIQYMGLCVFSLPNSPVIIVRMRTLSYYHHQTGSMNHLPLFRVRSWNNGNRCMSYYVLTR